MLPALLDHKFHSPLFDEFRRDIEAWDEDDAIVVSIDLPGFAKGNISVVREKGVLTVSAERSFDDSKKYLLRSRPAKFERSIRLPSGLEPDGAQAEYKDGVLTVRLKKSQATKPRRIEIT